MKTLLKSIAAALILMSAAPLTANAQERYTSVDLIAENTQIEAGQSITIATEISLKDHWHVYWLNPGDSGVPVEIDWTLPEGFEITDISWPTPDKIKYDILANYGYYDQVTLLQTITAPDTLPEGPITLSAEVDMLVCNDICIPEVDTATIDLNTGTAQSSKAHITMARAKMPDPLDGTLKYTEDNGDLIITIETDEDFSTAPSHTLEYFPLDWGIVKHIEDPHVTKTENQITIRHPRGDRNLSEIETLNGLLVVKGEKGENKGYVINGKADKALAIPPAPTNEVKTQHAPPTAEDSAAQISWISAVLYALVGGLILNLMPCVFPVLSMKALSLVKMGEKEKSAARAHGIAYTLGVVLSFLLIGGILVAVKEAGNAVGWGFQLQNPIVIAVLAYLLFAVGLNLIGLFEFGSRMGNVGQKLTQGGSLASSFFTGTLATIVATPCTAPFMAAALGFAATQTPIVSMSVFAAIGFGLALPYLLLSFIPALRAFLPKPGAWMKTFKEFLAFPMFASTVWLIWIMNQQSGALGVLLVLLGMLAIAFSVWLSHHKGTGAARVIAKAVMILALIVPISSLFYVKTMEDAPSEKIYGEAYSPETLTEALNTDQPVFVEMTAAWCITCKLNHAVAINTKSTHALFDENNVRYLIGDWTNRNDTIAAYLESFDRNGVPLYVYYAAPDENGVRPDPVLLPQILTPSTIVNLFNI